VPQGPVLGPILSLIFISDIDSVCHGQTNIKLFADDAKLYNVVDLHECSLSLYTSLIIIATWAFA